jgi:predicted thioesterase
VRGAVDGGQTTVGTRIELDHLKPSYVGATVSARARLSAVDGRRLTFDVEVLEGDTVVARGIVVRAVVDRARFVRS